MEKIEKRIEQLGDALDRLSESITLLEEHEGGVLYASLRDSLIKRFELSYDLFWKVCKDHLLKVHGLDVASPKSVFRALLEQKIFTQQDLLVELVEMADDRNLTVHTYDQYLAEELVEKIVNYHELMSNVFVSVKK